MTWTRALLVSTSIMHFNSVDQSLPPDKKKLYATSPQSHISQMHLLEKLIPDPVLNLN